MLAVAGKPLPSGVLIISAGALAVPVLAGVVAPEWVTDEVAIFAWLTALVPAFLLAYDRGWRGALLALGLGVAVLVGVLVTLQLSGAREPSWDLLLGLVVAYIIVCLGIGVVTELLHRSRREVQRQVITDPLTDLPNRRHAEFALDQAFAMAERLEIPLCVALFDVDHFKSFNDRFGHAAGDEVLRTFADVLRTSTRRMNVSARFGGEEFISILSDADVAGAEEFVGRVREGLKKAPQSWGPVTVSCGLAAYEKGMGAPDFLVAAADRAMYAAKDAGRDRVVVAETGQGFVSGTPPVPSRGVSPAVEAEVGGVSPAVEPEVGVVATQPVAQSRTILLVDDDDEVRKLVVKILRSVDYSVIEADDPLGALDLLGPAGAEIDLLITDVMMPGMSGLTLADKASSLRPGLRVLYMSGYIHGPVSWPGASGMLTDFVVKPFAPDGLLEKVEFLLAKSAASV